MCPGINSFTFGAVHRPGRRGSHTSQKARCMRHPRLVLAARAHTTVGNEAGMWPGINGFTNCAPIADWSGVRKIYGVQRTNWVAHTWRCLPCVRREAGLPRLAHIAKGALYAPPDREAKGDVRRRKSKFAKRTWNVPWNQQFHFLESHFSIADSERGRAWSLLDRGRRRRAESQPTLTAKDLNELRTLSC